MATLAEVEKELLFFKENLEKRHLSNIGADEKRISIIIEALEALKEKRQQEDDLK